MINLDAGTDTGLEKFLRMALPLFFLLLLVMTFAGSYANFLVNHNFNMGDWYINYQGGFVRRGLSGELVFHLHQLTGLAPGVFVVALHSLFYATFLCCAFLLLRQQQILAPFALLVVSPVIFSFQINDPLGGYRKEIIGIATLALLCYWASTNSPQQFSTRFKTAALLFFMAVLCHELLAVFVPYLFAVYFLKRPTSLKKSFPVFLYGIPAVIAFLLSTRYMGDEKLMNAIYASLGEYAPAKGAIYGLIADSNEAFERVTRMIRNRDGKNHYFIGLFWIALSFIPIRSRVKHIFTQPLPCLMILASYAMTFPLFLVGTDWGRFIFMHSATLCLLCLMLTHISPNPLPNKIAQLYQSKNIRYGMNILFIVVLVLYATQWQMRHCCL